MCCLAVLRQDSLKAALVFSEKSLFSPKVALGLLFVASCSASVLQRVKSRARQVPFLFFSLSQSSCLQGAELCARRHNSFEQLLLQMLLWRPQFPEVSDLALLPLVHSPLCALGTEFQQLYFEVLMVHWTQSSW